MSNDDELQKSNKFKENFTFLEDYSNSKICSTLLIIVILLFVIMPFTRNVNTCISKDFLKNNTIDKVLYQTVNNTFVPSSENSNISNTIYKKFQHFSLYSLIKTIVILISLMRIEKELGSNEFFQLLIFSFFSNIILENIIFKLLKIPCESSGLKGILVSIAIWDILETESVDYYVLFTTLYYVGKPIICYNKNSISRIVGVAVGIISSILWALIKDYS